MTRFLFFVWIISDLVLLSFFNAIKKGGSMEVFCLSKGEKKVSLCSNSCCCPTVNFTDLNYVVIEDDYKGKVQLTNEQFELLKKTHRPVDY